MGTENLELKLYVVWVLALCVNCLLTWAVWSLPVYIAVQTIFTVGMICATTAFCILFAINKYA
jgi:hypothetical protein